MSRVFSSADMALPNRMSVPISMVMFPVLEVGHRQAVAQDFLGYLEGQAALVVVFVVLHQHVVHALQGIMLLFFMESVRANGIKPRAAGSPNIMSYQMKT